MLRPTARTVSKKDMRSMAYVGAAQRRLRDQALGVFVLRRSPALRLGDTVPAMGAFKTLNHVADRLCEAICRLNNDLVKSITCGRRIHGCFSIENSMYF